MAIEFDLFDAVNNDQTDGSQTGADTDFDDPENLKNDDTDVTFASLDGGDTDAFHDRLVALFATFLDSPDDFAIKTSAASQTGSVTATATDDGSLTALGFTGQDTGSGPETFIAYEGVPADGEPSGLQTVDGEDIYLFIDSADGLGDQMVLGYDASGNIAFAVYMVPNISSDGLTASVDLHIVSFQSLKHLAPGDGEFAADGNPDYVDEYDEEVDLGEFLTISATENVVLNFDGTPPGKNLFTIILRDGSSVETYDDGGKEFVDGSAVVVTPYTEVIELNTSSGGGPTTLALYDQHINPNKFITGLETMVFTFVTDPLYDSVVDPAVNQNLDQNEADLETNIQFKGFDTISGGSVIISQQVSGATASLLLTASDVLSGSETTTGDGFINGYSDDTVAPISLITVYDDTGAAVGTWTETGDDALGYLASGETQDGITVTFNDGTSYPDGTVTVTGFDDDYEIAYEAALHQRIMVGGISGKFDIGGLGIDQPGGSSVTVGQNVVWDDDGPSVSIDADDTFTVTLDETVDGPGATSDDDGDGTPLATKTIMASDYLDGSTSTESGGSDGLKSSGTSWAFVDPDGLNSGLTDTATGESVFLFLEPDGGSGFDIVGRAGTDKADAIGGEIVVTWEIDETDGDVTVTQLRAIVHYDTTDPDDADFISPLGASPANELAAGSIVVAKTVSDNDDDTASDPADISAAFIFKDDGPSVSIDADDTFTVTLDETVDGPGATSDDDGDGTPLATKTIMASDYLDGSTSTESGGSDGLKSSGTSWAFVDPDGLNSGLTDTATGESVFLFLEPDGGSGFDIVGRAGTDKADAIGGEIVVTWEIDETDGDVTVTQLRAIVHYDTTDPDDADFISPLGASPANELAAGSIVVAKTVSDNDDDTASDPADISAAFIFKDDGPSVSIDADDTFTVTLDETVDGPGATSDDDGDGTPLATKTIMASDYLDGSTSTESGGSDGLKSSGTSWAFVDPDGLNSGLTDTATGESVFLFLEPDGGSGFDIVGRAGTDKADAIGGEIVVTWEIDETDGDVTVTQLRAIVHYDTTDPDDADFISPLGASPANELAAGSIVVAKTVSDNDDDTASDPADISAAFIFKDDGPSVSIDADDTFTVTLDETVDGPGATSDDDGDGTPLATKTIMASDYLDGSTSTESGGSDGLKSSGTSWAFVDPDGLNSGLTDTATGESVFLFLEPDGGSGFDIVGRAGTDKADAIGGEIVVTWEIDETDGDVTVTQLRAIVHYDTTDPDDADFISPLGASPANELAAGSIVVAKTVSDNDDDTASDPADISAAFIFKDDGPSVSIDADDTFTVTLDETVDGPGATSDDDGDGTPLATKTIMASDYLDGSTSTESGGSDGLKSSGTSWAFVDPDGLNSGLTDTATGESVFLFLEPDGGSGFDIVGRAGTDKADAIGGEIVVTWEIDETDGDVTVTQLRAIVHYDTTDPDDADFISPLGASPANELAAGSIVVAKTVSDNDDDTASDPADISAAFIFKDDGPSVSIDADDTFTVTLDETVDGPGATSDDDGDGTPLATKTIMASDYLDGSTSTESGGSDGLKSSGTSWAFVDPDGLNSGLTDTATGESVFLFLEPDGGSGFDIVGRAGTDKADAIGGEIVVTWEIDETDGDVTVTQLRAIVHYDTTDPDDADFISPLGASPANELAAGSIVVAKTVSDNDDDTASDPADISAAFIFKDDGPTSGAELSGTTLTHDESAGLQNSAPLAPDSDVVEDNNDDDVALTDPSYPAVFAALGTALGWAESAGTVVRSTSALSYGSDGAAASDDLCWTLSLNDLTDVDTGWLTLDDKKILLNIEDVDTLGGTVTAVVGRIDADGDGGVEGDDVAVAFIIDKTDGTLSMAQYVPIQHATTAIDEAVFLPGAAVPDDNILFAVQTVTDGDGDEASEMVALDEIVSVEDDGPLAGNNNPVNVEEDDINIIGVDEDGSEDNESASFTFDFSGAAPNNISGVDTPVSFSFVSSLKDEFGDPLLPVLKSQGDPVTYVLSSDGLTIEARAEYVDASDPGRLVFDLVLEIDATDPNIATITMTVYEQLDHEIEADSGSENVNLQVDGGSPISNFNISAVIDFEDADGDKVSVGDVQFVVIDDKPLLEGNIVDGFVEFSSTGPGNTDTEDLNGKVGTDLTDSDNESQQGTKTYTFTGDADDTLPDTEVVPGLLAKYSFDGDWGDDENGTQENTRIIYYVDSGDGAGGDPDGIAQQDEVYFDIVLGDQGDDGDYTFTVYKDAPEVFTAFDFTDLPSGQNLHGTIAKNQADASEGGLLIFPKNIDLDDAGKFTNVSETTNTSKGGGPVTIGNSNQMFDPGEGHYFAYVDNPVEPSIAGVGLDQNNADLADTVGFDGTNEVKIAEFEIVQVQGNKLAKVLIQAWDMNIQADGDVAEESVGTDVGELDPRLFLNDPEFGGTDASIDVVKVYMTAELELERDGGPAATVLFEATRVGSDGGDTALIDFKANGDVEVGGLDAGYSVQFETAIDHDLSLITNVQGKYDIGGFNTLAVNETPDQEFNYNVLITDFDEDNATDSFMVEVDGTGSFDG